jgi:hypothetical protein
MPMQRTLRRRPSLGTLYPITIPGHGAARDRPATLYFTYEQLVELRVAVAEAILKANKHRMESR